MKIVNIDGENLHVLWTTRIISIKFSGKMWLMIILKVGKNHGFTLSLEDTFLEKPQEGSNWGLKAFNDFRNKQQKQGKVYECFLICKSVYIVKVYSMHSTLR